MTASTNPVVPTTTTPPTNGKIPATEPESPWVEVPFRNIPKGPKSMLQCTYCRRFGHTVQKCWSAHPSLKPSRCATCRTLRHPANQECWRAARPGPEVKPVEKTEVKTEAKTEAKTEVKSEVKSEVKTEVKTTTKTGLRAAATYCPHCKKAGHTEERCWALHPKLRPMPCTHCKVFGHTREKCWALHPELKKGVGKSVVGKAVTPVRKETPIKSETPRATD